MVAKPDKPKVFSIDWSESEPSSALKIEGTLTCFIQDKALLDAWLANTDPTVTIDGQPAPKWIVDRLRAEGLI